MIVCSMLLLLIYWLARTWLIFRHSEEVVNRVLDSDLRWVRTFLP